MVFICAKKMTWGFKAFVILSEDVGLIQNSYMVVNNICNSSSRGFSALSGFHVTLACLGYTGLNACKTPVYKKKVLKETFHSLIKCLLNEAYSMLSILMISSQFFEILFILAIY